MMWYLCLYLKVSNTNIWQKLTVGQITDRSQARAFGQLSIVPVDNRCSYERISGNILQCVTRCRDTICKCIRGLASKSGSKSIRRCGNGIVFLSREANAGRHGTLTPKFGIARLVINGYIIIRLNNCRSNTTDAVI